jgi:hypothetical protein
MTVRLALDIWGNPIQSLAPMVTVSLAIGVASVNAALPAGAEVVRIAANNKCFIKFGTVGVVATGADLVFPIGSEVFRVPTGATHIAVIQDGASTGLANVTSME